jgi:hypothetical protein
MRNINNLEAMERSTCPVGTAYCNDRNRPDDLRDNNWMIKYVNDHSLKFVHISDVNIITIY